MKTKKNFCLSVIQKKHPKQSFMWTDKKILFASNKKREKKRFFTWKLGNGFLWCRLFLLFFDGQLFVKLFSLHSSSVRIFFLCFFLSFISAWLFFNALAFNFFYVIFWKLGMCLFLPKFTYQFSLYNLVHLKKKKLFHKKMQLSWWWVCFSTK